MKLNHLFAIFLALCGLIALGKGAFEFYHWFNGREAPSVVSLEYLGSQQHPSNVHITVTDFEFADSYVEEYSRRSKKARCVWIPLNLPGATEFSPEPPYPVIVRVNDLEDHEARMQDVFSRTELTGMVTSGLTGISIDARNQLIKSTKQINLHEAIILEIDQHFPDFKTTTLTLMMAIVFFAVAAHAAWAQSPPPPEPTDEMEDPSLPGETSAYENPQN